MDLGIAGRVAIVTASSRGLGRAAALALAGEGCNLVVCSRGGAALRETTDQLLALGVQAAAVELDLADEDAAQSLVDAAIDRFGRLDILLANIGGPPSGDPFDLPEAAYKSTIENNVLSQVRLVRAAVAAMRENQWGRICLVTSTGLREPLPGHGLSAFRLGLWGWAKSVSHELISQGITINAVCPGLHRTERLKEPGFTAGAISKFSHLAGSIGEPEDFGAVVAFLCSERARWLNGVALNVDGGTTLAAL